MQCINKQKSPKIISKLSFKTKRCYFRLLLSKSHHRWIYMYYTHMLTIKSEVPTISDRQSPDGFMLMYCTHIHLSWNNMAFYFFQLFALFCKLPEEPDVKIEDDWKLSLFICLLSSWIKIQSVNFIACCTASSLIIL